MALSFTSSTKTGPSELEVSDAMVALSATAVRHHDFLMFAY